MSGRKPHSGAEHRERRLHVDARVAGADGQRVRLGGRQAGLERAVDEQAPDLLEGHRADEVLDVDAAVAQRAALLVGLGDLGREGDDAFEAGLDVVAHAARNVAGRARGEPRGARAQARPPPRPRAGAAATSPRPAAAAARRTPTPHELAATSTPNADAATAEGTRMTVFWRPIAVPARSRPAISAAAVKARPFQLIAARRASSSTGSSSASGACDERGGGGDRARHAMPRRRSGAIRRPSRSERRPDHDARDAAGELDGGEHRGGRAGGEAALVVQEQDEEGEERDLRADEQGGAGRRAARRGGRAAAAAPSTGGRPAGARRRLAHPDRGGERAGKLRPASASSAARRPPAAASSGRVSAPARRRAAAPSGGCRARTRARCGRTSPSPRGRSRRWRAAPNAPARTSAAPRSPRLGREGGADERERRAAEPGGEHGALADAVGERAPDSSVAPIPQLTEARTSADLGEREAELVAQRRAERGQAHAARPKRGLGAHADGEDGPAVRSRAPAPRAVAPRLGHVAAACIEHQRRRPAGRAVVEARGAGLRRRRCGSRARSAGVPSIRAASSATMPSARRGESAGARSASSGRPSPASTSAGREPASTSQSSIRRSASGSDRLRPPCAARTPASIASRSARASSASPGGGGAGSGQQPRRHEPLDGVAASTRHSTSRRQRSRRVLTRSSAGRPPSQYQ